MMQRISNVRWMQLALVALIALAALLYAANMLFGTLNQDEGWYLYAALSSHQGQMPYRDFFFTQGPVLPVVYGWLVPLWSSFGVAGGRVLTAILGMIGGVLVTLLAMCAVARERRFTAALLAFAFIAANVYHSYFTVIPKTYALAAVLLLAGYLALVASARAGRVWLAVLAGLLLATAAGTRLSLGALLAVTGFWLLAQQKLLPMRWFWFGIGGAAGLALVYGPALVLAPEQWRFANSFHVGREGGGLLFIAGSIARCIRGYLPLWLFGVAVAVWQIWLSRDADMTGETKSAPRWPQLWLLSFAAVFAVHLLSPYPYDDYQVPVMPLLAAVVAVAAARMVALEKHGALVCVVATAALLAAVSSPINQDWFMIRQDRFWVVKRAPSDLAKLQQTGKWIRENSPADKPLLTQDTYLAVEAQRRVPAGFEMGPFGYFPALDDATAARLHVLNHAGLLRALRESDASMAAFSGYGLAIGAPSMKELSREDQQELWQTLAEQYDRIRVVPDFGQGATTLTIWSRRIAPPPLASNL